MAKKTHTVSYSESELKKMQSQSDWNKAAAMTTVEIETAIASDPDEADLVIDWSLASIELPKPKAILNMRVDADVMAFFRSQGRGYQTKINAILRSYVDAQQLPKQ